MAFVVFVIAFNKLISIKNARQSFFSKGLVDFLM